MLIKDIASALALMKQSEEKAETCMRVTKQLMASRSIMVDTELATVGSDFTDATAQFSQAKKTLAELMDHLNSQVAVGNLAVDIKIDSCDTNRIVFMLHDTREPRVGFIQRVTVSIRPNFLHDVEIHEWFDGKPQDFPADQLKLLSDQLRRSI